MIHYPIDKHLPVFPRRCQRNKYPFAQMVPGDSFFVPFSNERGRHEDSVRSSLYGSAGAFAGRNPGFLFVIRRVDGGYRFWRVGKMPRSKQYPLDLMCAVLRRLEETA